MRARVWWWTVWRWGVLRGASVPSPSHVEAWRPPLRPTSWPMRWYCRWYSPYLLACYDPDTEELQSVCRVMSGFSDQFYRDSLERWGGGGGVDGV